MSPNLPSFPQGWQDRLISLDFGDVKAFFVEPNDVAASRYMRGEDRHMRWLANWRPRTIGWPNTGSG